MENKATAEELESIHSHLAKWCTLVLQGVPLMSEGEAVLKPDGQPWLVPPSPAHMNIIRQFLKDNHIDSQVSPKNPLGVLKEASELPFQHGSSVVPFNTSKAK